MKEILRKSSFRIKSKREAVVRIAAGRCISAIPGIHSWALSFRIHGSFVHASLVLSLLNPRCLMWEAGMRAQRNCAQYVAPASLYLKLEPVSKKSSKARETLACCGFEIAYPPLTTAVCSSAPFGSKSALFRVVLGKAVSLPPHW